MARLCLARGGGHAPYRSISQFAERSLGWKLASVNAVLNTAGLLIIVVGAVRGLL
jgi:hypothetical protein